jgi:hypothetical protein
MIREGTPSSRHIHRFQAFLVASLAPVWAPRLNQWHLFDDPDDAEAYATITEQRVPEHAPFFAYGIYQLRLLPSSRYPEVS